MSDAEHPYLSTQPPSPLVSWSQQLALSIAKVGSVDSYLSDFSATPVAFRAH